MEAIRPYEEWPLETLSAAAGGASIGVPWSSGLETATGAAETKQRDPLDDTLETTPRPAPVLGGIVKTADQLMALPLEEQPEMVAFLQPAELAGIMKRTDNPELKRAVIDTLEHVGTPASLDVLRECLEDADPEIQMYALKAADRILGTK
jgi:hypothetical protein